MTFTLRHASFSDLGTLVRLNNEVQRLHSQLDPSFFKTTTDVDELEAFFETVLEKLDDRVILAEENDLPVGYVWFQVQQKQETPFTWPRRQIYIFQIAVDEAFRRRGVGSVLISHVEQHAEEAGIDKIVLDTWAINAAAQGFYHARGFQHLTIGYEKSLKTDFTK
jgi:ribosomal protein S18 acetylase RimI-like enzyme